MRPQPIQFLYSGAMLASLVFIPLYASEVLGLKEFQIGLIVFAYAFVMFSSSYVFGRFSDVYGRKKMLFIGLFACGVAMALQVFTWNFATLFIVRCLVGLSLGLFPAALLAYAHEGKSKMGKFTSWGSLGWGIITFMGGAFIVLTNIRAVFILSSAVCFVAFALALMLPKSNFKSSKAPRLPIKLLKKNLHYYLPLFLRHAVASGIWTFWPLLLRLIGAGPMMMGFIMFINAATQFTVMFFISDKLDTNKLFLVGLCVSVVTFFGIFLAFIYESIWLMLVTQVFLGVAWASLYSSTVRYLLKNNKERASATGLMNSTISTSAIVGPLIATFVFLIGGGFNAILIISIIGAALSVGLFFIIRASKGHFKAA